MGYTGVRAQLVKAQLQLTIFFFFRSEMNIDLCPCWEISPSFYIVAEKGLECSPIRGMDKFKFLVELERGCHFLSR